MILNRSADSVALVFEKENIIGLITLCLYADLLRVNVDDVHFTVLQQDDPKQVVFLMGGDATTEDYFFKDLTLFEEYPDILFVGVGQSYTIKDNLGKIIEWVKTEYEFDNREQWSFFGFSLGAYETYSIALHYYHEVFGNYAAVGGGMSAELEEDPEIDYLYVCYGSGDIDKSSAEFAVKCLWDKGYVGKHNYKKRILDGVGHSLEEATIGLTTFLNDLESRSERSKRK